MPGSPDTQPAPDLPDERRLALVVATESYDDGSLRRLRAPGHDADDLRGVLADPDVGGFAVTSVTDGTAQEVRIAVGDFLADRRPDDLVLVYLSCHGLVDLRRRLYFAARDTTKARLAATGVEAQWLLDQLEDCRARRQVLILDCCFSGAFALGAKGDDDLGIGERFHGQGRGRVVLTASRDSEYSFEGEPVPGQAVPGSVFTSALVDGIRSGSADLDRDGYISVDDAYGYAFDTVRASNAEQTPQRWFYGAEGAILLARNPAGVTIIPAEVPDGIASSLESSYPSVRIGAVEAMAEWLDDDDPARIVAARQTLSHVAENDRPEVATRAQALLDAAETPRPVAAGSGAGGGGPADRDRAQPEVPGPRKGPSGIRSWLTEGRRVYGVGALLVAVVVLAALLWTRQLSDPSGGVPSGDSSGGSFTAAGPWRLEIHDRISDVSEDDDTGCSVTLDRVEGDETWQWVDLYGTYAWQIPYAGSFTWKVSHPGCQIVTRATPGEVKLPATFPAYRGDTDAFLAPTPITVEARDLQDGEECEVVLKDPNETSQASSVDIGTATKDKPSVSLDPAGHSEVYLAELSCGVRVTE